MKKIVFVLLIALVFTACTKLRKGNISIINVGGVEIKIPRPGIEYYDILSSGNIHIQASGPFITRNTHCSFKDTSGFKNKNSYNKGILKGRNLDITTFKEFESKNYTDDEFIKLRNEEIGTMNKDVNQIIERADSILNDNKGLVFYKSFENTVMLGCINDTINTFPKLQIKEINNKSGNRKILYAYNTLKVKNRSLHLTIECNFHDNEDLKWIINTSKSYTQSILNANK